MSQRFARLVLCAVLVVPTGIVACFAPSSPGAGPGSGSLEPEDVAAVEAAATTAGHNAAASYTNQTTCASFFIGNDQAERWGNNPDCWGNDCDANWPPDGLAGLSWACRNWDHFSINNFGLETNGGERAWRQAQALSYAQSHVQSGELAPLLDAFKRSYEACHYAVDGNQCGHVYGNMVCNPNLGEVDFACVQFVNNFNDVPINNGGQSASGIAVKNGCVINGFSEATAYAAAERYIRHHNPGLTLDNPAWVNHCGGGCPAGDSDGSPDNACQLGGPGSNNARCRELVQEVCDVRNCDPNACQNQGATCGSITDGCGTVHDCGSCQPGFTCNPDTKRCYCAAGVPAGNCGVVYYECGSYDYGSCPGGQSCVGNWCQQDCQTCASAGAQCGTISNGCGGSEYCGSCAPGWECNESLNTCSCASTPYGQCGYWSDQCGTVYLGSCGSGEECIDNWCQYDPCGGDPCCGDPCCGVYECCVDGYCCGPDFCCDDWGCWYRE